MQLSKSIETRRDIPSDPDAGLVRAAQNNPAAFQQIYDRWAVPVYQYFYHRTGQPEGAEDLTSKLFLSAYQALPRYQHRGHFPAWLFAIARNLSREYFRKTRRETPLSNAQHLVAASDPPGEVAHQDEITRLNRLVKSLPEDDQELIRLRYVAELPFAEMAIVIGKREDAVKKSLYRLQARLQILLEQNHE